MNTISCKSLPLLLTAALSFATSVTLAQTVVPDSPARVTPLSNGVELAQGASLLDVRILEDRIVSVHVRLDGKATPHTLVLAPQPALRTPSAVKGSEQNGVYTLSASGLTVRLQETSPYSIAFLDASGRQLLRSEDPFGEARASGVVMQRDDKGTLYGIHGYDWRPTSGGLARDEGGKVAALSQGDSGAPFVFTTSYGLLVDSDGGEFTTNEGRIAFGHGSRPDVEYFIMAGPPLETMAAVSRLVGTPPLPPRWTLGFLNSQWGSTQSEVENIVTTYRQKQLPLDGFILDYDWKAWGEDDYGEWRWNSTSGAGNTAPDKFPDGASGEFANWMRAHGVKLAGILKPRIFTAVAGDSNQPTVAAAYATEHGFWYPVKTSTGDMSGRMTRDLDFSNSEARTWFWQHLLPAFHSGVVAWWNDEADEYRTKPFNFPKPKDGKFEMPKDASNLPSLDFFKDVAYFNNFQFLNMGRALYEGQRADSNLRVWSINRNFYLGASRYGYALWSGDIRSGFASMAFQRTRMLAALDTGVFHWSMDVGGFAGHPTPENYARWMEFAAFVPIMRAHGGFNEKRQPWVYGPVAEAAARQALELRYSLLPYIYSYERLTTEGVSELVRPLFWQFPSDPEAAAQSSEWMFGDALLVSPVVTEGATSQTVYLPAGGWFDYATGRRYIGPQIIQVPVDSKTWKDIPLFVREGSILATQPVEQYVGQNPVSEITLDIFPSDAAASFTVYDDDGQTYNYDQGEYLRQQVTMQRSGKAIRVTIDGATGSYAGPLRTYLLRVHSAASHVALDGKALPAAKAKTDASRPDTSWERQNDHFGPVALVHVTAAAKTPAVLTLQ